MTSTNDNMRIWKQVCKTDPKFTKEANNGRFKFTTIDPQYQTEQATKLWGPYGHLWGLKHIETQFVGSDDSQLSCIFSAVFFYPSGAMPDPDEEVPDYVPTAEFPIVVDGKFRPGADTLKSLMTQAKSKALSYLGFGADVFMGKFDDEVYRKMTSIHFTEGDAVTKRMTAAVKTCETLPGLEAKESKVIEMIADDIISAAAGHEVIVEIAKKRVALGG